MIGADWTPHRRDDGELLGWIRPDGDAWAAVDLLGRPASGATEWLDAEAALEALGIAYLAEPWMLEGEGESPVRVRFVEVTPQRIVVKGEDFGAVDALTRRWELPWPIPARLRPPRPGDPDAFVIDR
ncbi:hypothetical protein [Microbacterium sp. PA5]|uniref:hypothetical protein n=1 Tax=Microbacterium sp. PA5 TaxID=3416654 RepID=UPI003CF945F1